jgi:hypothetical protein
MRAVAGRWCWVRTAETRAVKVVSLIRSRDWIAGGCKGERLARGLAGSCGELDRHEDGRISFL